MCVSFRKKAHPVHAFPSVCWMPVERKPVFTIQSCPALSSVFYLISITSGLLPLPVQRLRLQLYFPVRPSLFLLRTTDVIQNRLTCIIYSRLLT